MADLELSVIVICLNSTALLAECLSALSDQATSPNTEILAVGHWTATGDQPVEIQRFTTVHWISVPGDTTVPQMRTCGILQSRGKIVALLEDDCLVSPGWRQAVAKAHAWSHPAIGGAIAPGKYRRLLDWAVYFCEYARFMPPFSGEKNALPGNHVSYKREFLTDLKEGEGFYEVFLHNSWVKSGIRLIADPTLVVTNINTWSLRHVTGMPFHHGRAFAAMRAAEFTGWRKGMFALLSAALPVVKAARLAREVAGRRRYLQQFIFSLPWTMVFLTSWSIGELFGYIAGPGKSIEEWR